MSADNGLVIRNHPNGGYAVAMWLGENWDDTVPTMDYPEYATLGAAMMAADEIMRTEIVEYGVSLHSEVRKREADKEQAEINREIDTDDR